MAYEASKDQALETWQNEETGLSITIYKYGEGEPKLQIGPRTYKKKDGSATMVKAGRLSIADLLWLAGILEEVTEKMKEHFLEAS
jgi:hypothetical protein